MGTEIFQIGPKKAKKNRYKDFNLDFKIITKTPFYHQNVSLKIRLGFKGPQHPNFLVILKCRGCFGMVLALAFQWALKLCDCDKNDRE